MTSDLDGLCGQIAALAEGSQTATSLSERALNHAVAMADLNAFVALDSSIVMAQAKAATVRRQQGNPLSPLDGVPIAVKDNYLTKDYQTTACSNALPMESIGRDATVVANLRQAGAIILGKTNMHEWAYGATNTVSSIGPTKNPHDLSRITGGSSGGSAAAVASGIVGAALGSDTGGSIRIPSAACGIYGFKPSYGRASRHGVLPLSWSLDAPGPMARNLEDIKALLPYFIGRDEHDRSTHFALPFSKQEKPDRPPRLLNLVGSGLERSDEVSDALVVALNASVGRYENVGLENVAGYFAAWEAILHCEASSYHVDLLEKNPNGFSPVTRAHLEAGNKVTGVEYLRAQRIRSTFISMLLERLPAWDALVLPTLPVVAPKQSDQWQEFGGRKVTTQDSMTWFCWLGNLAGFPCISIPIANQKSSLPVGMMLMGKPGQDEQLLAIAEWIDIRLRKEH